MESGGLVSPKRKRSLSWWVGALVIALTVPAVVFFVARDRVDSSTPSTTQASISSARLSDTDADGVVESGAGQCDVSANEIRISGSGMTACRVTEWSSTPYLDQQVSTDVSGIDEGATTVFRFRESGGQRVEVAVGRSAIVIREKNGDAWVLSASVPRQIPPTATTVPTSASLGSTHRVKVDLSGNLVTVEIDGVVTASGTTTIADSGLFSVGAVTNGSVAVRFSSISLTDAG